MTVSEPKVSIIIVHLDNRSALADCLQSCRKIGYRNHDIIIVANGSRPEPDLSVLQGLCERVRAVVRSPENLGYARGNNLGIRYAIQENPGYVLLLNDDTIVAPDFLEELVTNGEKRSDTGMLGSKIFFADRSDIIWFAGARLDRQTGELATPGANEPDHEKEGGPFESDYITGCALLVKADVISRIGLLDERFFLYWEDVDWGVRNTKAGFKNVIVPSSHVWHKISVSSGGMDSLVRVYHKTRSRLLFARLHLPDSLPRLHYRLARDIAWLLLKSTDVNRYSKARACMAAVRDYYRRRWDRGPDWIWTA